jgi:hypothetical protein
VAVPEVVPEAAPTAPKPKRGPGRPRKTETQAPEPPAEAVEAESGQESPEDEASPEGEVEPEGDRDSPEESDEEAEEGTDEERFEVKVNGKTYAVTLDELLNGYSREADYTRKSMALADERKALEAQRAAVEEDLAQRRQQLDQFLAYVMQTDPILAEAQQADMERLADEDPAKFVKLQAQLAKRGQLYQAWMAQKQQELASAVARERAALASKLPEAADPAVWAGEEKAIVAYLKNEGFSDREIAYFGDHRSIIVARKAMMWDRMQREAPATRKKVVNVPKVVRPGVASPRPTESSAVEQARARFRNSRSSKDAVALLEAQLLGRA